MLVIFRDCKVWWNINKDSGGLKIFFSELTEKYEEYYKVVEADQKRKEKLKEAAKQVKFRASYMHEFT